MHHDDHSHEEGLKHDLPRMIGRRGMLGLLAGAGGLMASPAVAAGCVALPWETAGPFPADGTNRRSGQVINALTQAGVIREDIRPSFNGMNGVAAGAEVVLDITLSDAAACTPLEGHAIYIWQCDAAGRYSLYNLAQENYLRGVGVSDAEGRVRFRTILPGCYPGRWPHIHFEVFESAEAAVSGRASILTSQIAFAEDVCTAVYTGHPEYEGNMRNLSRLSLARDGIFGNNTPAQIAQQTAALRGSAAAGFAGTVAIPLAL